MEELSGTLPLSTHPMKRRSFLALLGVAPFAGAALGQALAAEPAPSVRIAKVAPVSSTTTGALICYGGLGISGSIYVGGSLHCAAQP